MSQISRDRFRSALQALGLRTWPERSLRPLGKLESFECFKRGRVARGRAAPFTYG